MFDCLKKHRQHDTQDLDDQITQLRTLIKYSHDELKLQLDRIEAIHKEIQAEHRQMPTEMHSVVNSK